MSHVLHLLKKDLRAVRLSLLVLYGLLLVQAAIALRDPLTHDSVHNATTMGMLIPLGVLAIAALVIQQEPLVGSTAFWMTRPIPRSTLLLSKTVFLALFVVAPIGLVTLGILLAYGMEPGQAASGAAVSEMTLVVLLVSGVVVASVTPNMPVYVTSWICLLLASQLLNIVLDRIVTTRVGFSGFSATMIHTTAYFGAGAVLIVHQYLTSRTRRTLMGLGLAMALMPLATSVWIWQGLGSRTNDRAVGEEVVLEIKTASGDGTFPASPQIGFDTTFPADIQIQKAPAGRDLFIHSVEAGLLLNGTEQARVEARNTPIEIKRGGIEAALPGFRWMGRPESFQVVAGLTLGSGSTFERLAGRPATLRGTVGGTLRYYRLAGTIPLTSGARYDGGSTAAIVESVSRHSSTVSLVLRTRSIAGVDESGFPRIVLINRKRLEVVEGESQESGSNMRLVGFAGPIVQGSEWKMGFPFSTQRASIILDSEWLRDAELAFIETVPAGSFNAPIEIEDFRLADATATPQGMFPDTVR
jgi:hypothetical protein